jgi:hypothetical protein
MATPKVTAPSIMKSLEDVSAFMGKSRGKCAPFPALKTVSVVECCERCFSDETRERCGEDVTRV